MQWGFGKYLFYSVGVENIFLTVWVLKIPFNSVCTAKEKRPAEKNAFQFHLIEAVTS